MGIPPFLISLELILAHRLKRELSLVARDAAAAVR
jgi:hypothetical protein